MKPERESPRIALAFASWLKVGVGVKRWLVLLGIGAATTGMGIASLLIALRQSNGLPLTLYRLITLSSLPIWLRVMIPLSLGSIVMVVAIYKLGATLVAPFRPPEGGVARSLYTHGQRRKGPKIVAIGGGTGLPGLLRGLTRYTNNITAIVTVADDGGSSGRLRRELGLLPPGDFRNNIAALARDEILMTQLLQYRFAVRQGDDETERTELGGHAFGNILLAALTGVTGSFDEALIAVGRVLAMNGRVVPSTLANVALVAQLIDSTSGEPVQVFGESAIPRARGRIKSVSLEPHDAPAYPPAVKAILNADAIIIGPGSLYTSIMPNLLVAEIGNALRYTRAKRIYVCNLATQPGETDNYSVADHVTALAGHLDADQVGIENWLDLVLANDNFNLPTEAGGGNTVFVRLEEADGLATVAADLADVGQPWRHDSDKLARAVIELIDAKSNKNYT